MVFFRVNRGSVAEKSWLACATGAGVAALAWNHSRSARAVELRVPGDLFSSLLTLCYGSLHVLVEVLCALELVHQSDVFYSTEYCVAILFCFAKLQVQIAAEWLRQGCSKSTCSSVAPCGSDCVLRIIVGRSHWNCYIKLCDLNVRICMKHFFWVTVPEKVLLWRFFFAKPGQLQKGL